MMSKRSTSIFLSMSMITFFILIGVFPVFDCMAAKSLESAARGVEKKAFDLALLIAPLGFLIAGAYMAFGREEGKSKVALAILGVICIVGAGPFIQWIKSIF